MRAVPDTPAARAHFNKRLIRDEHWTIASKQQRRRTSKRRRLRPRRTTMPGWKARRRSGRSLRGSDDHLGDERLLRNDPRG